MPAESCRAASWSPGLDFFRKKTQMVRGLRMRDEDALRIVDLPGHRKSLRQPESTKDERPLLAADSIVGPYVYRYRADDGVGPVAIHVRAIPQLGLNPLHRPEHSSIAWRQEAMNRQQKQRCIWNVRDRTPRQTVYQCDPARERRAPSGARRPPVSIAFATAGRQTKEPAPHPAEGRASSSASSERCVASPARGSQMP